MCSAYLRNVTLILTPTLRMLADRSLYCHSALSAARRDVEEAPWMPAAPYCARSLRGSAAGGPPSPLGCATRALSPLQYGAARVRNRYAEPLQAACSHTTCLKRVIVLADSGHEGALTLPFRPFPIAAEPVFAARPHAAEASCLFCVVRVRSRTYVRPGCGLCAVSPLRALIQSVCSCTFALGASTYPLIALSVQCRI